MNKIEQEFIEKGLVDMRPNGRWFVLSKINAIEFVKACQKENISILGIDAFYLNGSLIQPSMDNSIDYTSHTHKDKTDIYSQALNFLSQQNENLYFEVVCPE